MSKQPVIFLDDGGVINDNEVRARQWQRLVGDFYAPRFGGTHKQWAEANRVFVTEIFEPAAWEARLAAAGDYPTYERTYFLDWMRRMCDLVGVECPAEEEAIHMASEGSAWIVPQIRAAFPGAVGAIRLLHRQGYTLHMASGASSIDLEGYLGGLGVRDCFDRLYGPDLIDTLKASPLFYERLLADAGVAPADALIVDDNALVLSWVREVGAQTVFARRGRDSYPPDVSHIIDTIADLPALVAALSPTN